jgi:acetyl esterase/lipase
LLCLVSLLAIASCDRGRVLEDVAIERDVVYSQVEGRPLTLDVYLARAAPRPQPVLLFAHGGGWVEGDKDAAVPERIAELAPGVPRVPSMLPYLRRGVAVVSIEYRLAGEAPAPAAVEDCRRALAWVREHGAAHGLDATRIVPIGPSAGGHLALMLALGAEDATAGIVGAVDLYGITDVADVVDGPNARWWAQEWIPPAPDRLEQARALSPLLHVRRDAPPILIVHGDGDEEVPYDHALRLRDALTAAGAPVELLTLAGGGHGYYGAEHLGQIEERLTAFLVRVGMLAP